MADFLESSLRIPTRFGRNDHAARLLKVSDTTADKSVKLLASLKILQEATGRSWGRVWVAKPILKVLENPPPEAPEENM